MVDMGVKPYAIATSVNLIIAQRLARRLCTHCKQPLDIPKDALLKEGFTEADLTRGLKILRAQGMLELYRRLQGPDGYLPGVAGHGCDSPDHSRHGQRGWRSPTRLPRKACGICGAPGSRR